MIVFGAHKLCPVTGKRRLVDAAGLRRVRPSPETVPDPRRHMAGVAQEYCGEIPTGS
jgi:hypothetical protein